MGLVIIVSVVLLMLKIEWLSLMVLTGWTFAAVAYLFVKMSQHGM